LGEENILNKLKKNGLGTERGSYYRAMPIPYVFNITNRPAKELSFL
jgi:hypothetical protein